MAAKAGELMRELGDPQRLGLHPARSRAAEARRSLGILGQRLGLVQHGRSLPQQLARGNPVSANAH